MDQAPFAPFDISVESVSGTVLRVEIGAATEPDSAAPIQKYKVEWDVSSAFNSNGGVAVCATEQDLPDPPTTLNDHFCTLRTSSKYYVYDINPLASGIVVRVSSGSVSAASDEASNGGEVHALPTGADGDCAGFLAAEFPGLEQFNSDHTFEVLTNPDPGTSHVVFVRI